MVQKTKTVHQSAQIPMVIILTAKFLQAISPRLVTWFAAKLFTTPIKHKVPKRELQMDTESIQTSHFVPSIKKTINIYNYGIGKKRILLVHGWSGRGTQLVKIADALLDLGYSTISFDAPAHGKSKGNSTIMTEFIASIVEIEKVYGPFDFAIGHSLGGMAIINAIKQNAKFEKAVLIGSGDIIQDIIDDFIRNLQLKPTIGNQMRMYFEKKYSTTMNNYSTSVAAINVEPPVLIIHDEHDDDVNIKAAYNIHKHLKNSKLIVTKDLGHRKILGNPKVIDEIIKFLKIKSTE